jgi:hypothetical protein
MSPKLDLAKLAEKVQDSEFVPVRRGRTAEENYFLDVVLESYNTEQGKVVPVALSGETTKAGEDKNVVKVVNQLRAAARYHEIGVSIQIEPHSKTITHVLFLGKERRKYEKNGEATE